MPAYKPISCDFYDELEAVALHRSNNEIVYRDAQGQELKTTGIITGLTTVNKEEFLTLDNGLVIRLDQLVSLNGIVLANYC